MKLFSLVATLAVLGVPAFAEGDIAAGEQQFNRQCVACHVVADASGTVLAGRNAKTGPNLFGIAGRTPGSVDGFRYGDSIVEYGQTGAVWSEDLFVAYVQSPSDFLKEALNNNRARAKMAYQVREESQAFDIYAYLSQFSQ